MERELRLIIHWKKFVYDDFLVTLSNVNENKHFEDKTLEEKKSVCDKKNSSLSVLVPKFLNNRQINSYAVSAYVYYLKNSQCYRRHAIKALLYYSQSRVPPKWKTVIAIKLREPKKQFLDYTWGKRAAYMALEKCEVDHAMSWLSTLGGAFSALGEQFHHCAQIAGKISIHQFELALRLGDPLLVARCKLYAALSIIQQGNLRIPKKMIKDIYKFALEQKDTHLQRMCQGVWAKLKYCYKLKKQRKKQ